MRTDRNEFIEPNSERLENYSLAMAFKSPELADDLLANLTEEHYYEDFNDRVFKAIRNLRELGQEITSVTVEADILASYNGAEIPFDFPDAKEITKRYSPFLKMEANGLPEAFRRLKEDANYRQVIYTAQDAIRKARLREGTPLEILSPVENLQTEILQSGRRVIVWADEAERQAQETYDALDKGELLAIPTGFPEIDKILYGGGMWKGDYFVISGATSGGKTTLALNMLDNAAELGFRDLYFSLEMKTFKIFSRIHSRKAKIPGYKIRPNMSEIYGSDRGGKTIREKLRETGGRVARLPFGIIDSVKDMETIRKISKMGVTKHGVNRIILDYEGLARPSKRFRGGSYQRATEVSEMCKDIATELDVPLIALNQLRRKTSAEKQAANNGAGTDAGNEVEPDLEMLKESGAIENNADTVLFVWGEKGREGETEAIRDVKFKIAKQRNGGLGRGKLHFAPDIFNFTSSEEMKKHLEQTQRTDF